MTKRVGAALYDTTRKDEFKLICDVTRGLSKEDVLKSRSKFGSNTIKRGKKRSFLSKFISNLGDPIIKILIGALVINVAFMMKNINWPETRGIECAVLIATLVSTISEHGSEAAFEKMNEQNGGRKVTVMRGGKKRDIPEEEIVSGDVIYVGAGMSIPADCFIISGSVSVNQAPLTGESNDIKKYPHKLYGNEIEPLKESTGAGDASKIYKGCLCTKGECKAVVYSVGETTEYGRIAKELIREDKKSPLKERLSELAKTVSYLGYVAAFMIIVAYLFNAVVIDSSWNPAIILLRLKDVRFLLSEILNAITLGVSVIVVAVPEGLPMMITVVLSSNMKRMLRSGVLVRKMVGIETAGCMNILFTDKTGTLTSGNMTVRKVVTTYGEFNNAGDLMRSSSIDFNTLLSDYLVGETYRTPTEKALISFAKGASNRTALTLTEKLKFNSDNKYSACLYESSGIKKCAVLGAAEKLLSMCDYALSETGTVRLFDSCLKDSIKRVIKNETAKCSRILVLAGADAASWRDIQCDRRTQLIFYALISIRDEVRKDIISSVREAEGAGVQVVMVTGDNVDTAVAVANETGIINDKYFVDISGEQLRGMTDDELKELLPKLAVVSRALPSDKHRLVSVSGKMGLVSGMTGDGINDAPSLKEADVGFAMGSGSDVAKKAADIILTNNSFKSITNAILYGRCVFESIRKFISFQLTMNLCALGVSLIGPFIGIESPITVIQMLWVNIIMDTLGGLAFAGEIPLAEYMRRAPMKRNDKILTSKMVSQILCCGIYTLALCIFFLKVPFFKSLISSENDTYFLTCFFALFLFCGLFNSFNSRAPVGGLFSHIAGNKAFISILLFVTAAQLGIIFFGGETFRCVPVSPRDLLICFVLSSSVIPIDQIRKKLSGQISARRG